MTISTTPGALSAAGWSPAGRRPAGGPRGAGRRGGRRRRPGPRAAARRRPARRVSGRRRSGPAALDASVGPSRRPVRCSRSGWWVTSFTVAVVGQARATIRSGRPVRPLRSASAWPVRPLASASASPAGSLVGSPAPSIAPAAAAALGVALSAGPVAAHAEVDRPAGGAASTTGASPTGPTAPATGRRGPPARPSDAAWSADRPTGRGAVVVRPGDTLWTLAAARLGDGDPADDRPDDRPDDRAVAAAWPRWWHANRAVDRPRPRPDPARPGPAPTHHPRGATDDHPTPDHRPPAAQTRLRRLPVPACEPPYDDELDPAARSRRGPRHRPGPGRSRRCRARSPCPSCCPAGSPRSRSRPRRTCGSCPLPTRSGLAPSPGPAADRTSTTSARSPPAGPPCPTRGPGADGWCRPWSRCWPATGRLSQLVRWTSSEVYDDVAPWCRSGPARAGSPARPARPTRPARAAVLLGARHRAGRRRRGGGGDRPPRPAHHRGRAAPGGPGRAVAVHRPRARLTVRTPGGRSVLGSLATTARRTRPPPRRRSSSGIAPSSRRVFHPDRPM